MKVMMMRVMTLATRPEPLVVDVFMAPSWVVEQHQVDVEQGVYSDHDGNDRHRQEYQQDQQIGDAPCVLQRPSLLPRNCLAAYSKGLKG